MPSEWYRKTPAPCTPFAEATGDQDFVPVGRGSEGTIHVGRAAQVRVCNASVAERRIQRQRPLIVRVAEGQKILRVRVRKAPRHELAARIEETGYGPVVGRTGDDRGDRAPGEHGPGFEPLDGSRRRAADRLRALVTGDLAREKSDNMVLVSLR